MSALYVERHPASRRSDGRAHALPVIQKVRVELAARWVAVQFETKLARPHQMALQHGRKEAPPFLDGPAPSLVFGDLDTIEGDAGRRHEIEAAETGRKVVLDRDLVDGAPHAQHVVQFGVDRLLGRHEAQRLMPENLAYGGKDAGGGAKVQNPPLGLVEQADPARPFQRAPCTSGNIHVAVRGPSKAGLVAQDIAVSLLQGSEGGRINPRHHLVEDFAIRIALASDQGSDESGSLQKGNGGGCRDWHCGTIAQGPAMDAKENRTVCDA